MNPTTVKVSAKFQVVIPRDIRQHLALEVGQSLQVISHGDRIELIPVRPIQEMRGYLQGPNTFKREGDRL